jgi:hypothetical protein
MTPAEDDLPVVARSARALGVRVGGPNSDVVLDDEGRVAPGTGGMSVAPTSMWNLPNHRRPIGMGRGSTGKEEDRVFSIERENLAKADLKVRLDEYRPTKHAFVEPVEPVVLPSYETKLASARADWVQEWP